MAKKNIRRSIDCKEENKNENERRNFFAHDGQSSQVKSSQLYVYSHLFVLSKFQAPHMDRCFPFHSSELELDGKLLSCCTFLIVCSYASFSLLGLAIIWPVLWLYYAHSTFLYVILLFIKNFFFFSSLQLLSFNWFIFFFLFFLLHFLFPKKSFFCLIVVFDNLFWVHWIGIGVKWSEVTADCLR